MEQSGVMRHSAPGCTALEMRGRWQWVWISEQDKEERTQGRERSEVKWKLLSCVQARILEWVAVPFSRGSSQPWDRTHVSLVAGEFFTSWANREAEAKGRTIVGSWCWSEMLRVGGKVDFCRDSFRVRKENLNRVLKTNYREPGCPKESMWSSMWIDAQ